MSAPRTTPIAYAGHHQAGGSQASASVSGILARLFVDAGLRRPVVGRPGQAGRGHDQPGPQPLALTRWRVEHTYRTQGIKAALALSGLTSVRAVGELVRSVIAVDPQPIPAGGFLAG